MSGGHHAFCLFMQSGWDEDTQCQIDSASYANRKTPLPARFHHFEFWNCAHLTFPSIWIEETATENIILSFRHCFAVPCPRWKSRSLILSHGLASWSSSYSHFTSLQSAQIGQEGRIQVYEEELRGPRQVEDPYIQCSRLVGSILTPIGRIHTRWFIKLSCPVVGPSQCVIIGFQTEENNQNQIPQELELFSHHSNRSLITNHKDVDQLSYNLQKESALWDLRNMTGFVNFGGINDLPKECFRWQAESVRSKLVCGLFLELPVVRAVLKSLHQVHMRKYLSAVGYIRLRSNLAVMIWKNKKVVGTTNHKFLRLSRNTYAQHLTISNQIWLKSFLDWKASWYFAYLGWTGWMSLKCDEFH